MIGEDKPAVHYLARKVSMSIKISSEARGMGCIAVGEARLRVGSHSIWQQQNQRLL